MRKKTVKFMALSAVLAAGICLAACDSSKSTTTSDKSSTQVVTKPSTQSGSKQTTPEESTTPFVKKDDYNDITKTLKWKVNDTSSMVFETDGIEEATLRVATDGDTAGFTLKNSGENITVRFYGIDTPESTGGVEKWGKYASKFCKAKLENAYALMVESKCTKANYTGDTAYSPAVDSYGTRKLAYVWYKESADSEWLCLNLEMVENGFSVNKLTAEEAYYSAFQKAHDFAKKHQLHIFGDEEDPYFSDAVQYTDVKTLATDTKSFWDSENSVGSRVTFDCYVKSCTISSSGTYLFTVADYVEEDGKEYTFNVYTGYSSSQIQTYFVIGGQYTVTGAVQQHSGNWQVSGLTYVPGQTGGEYLTRNSKNYYMTFDSTIEYKSIYSKEALYGDATVISAELDDDILTIVASATNTKTKASENFEFVCSVTGSIDVESLVGKTFKATGLQREAGKIEVLKYSNISFK